MVIYGVNLLMNRCIIDINVFTYVEIYDTIRLSS